MSDVIEAALGPWSGLAVTGSKLGLQAAGVPGPAIELLAVVIGLESSQQALLQSIKKDTELLRKGPFRAAQLALQEAHRRSDEPDEVERAVKRAVDKLQDAYSQCDGPAEEAVVALHASLAYEILGVENERSHWLRQAALDGDRGVSALIKQAQSGPAQVSIEVIDGREIPRRSRTRGLWAAGRVALGATSGLFIIYGGFLGLAAIRGMTLQQRNRVERLADFIQFVNMVNERLEARAGRTPTTLLALVPTPAAKTERRARPVLRVERLSRFQFAIATAHSASPSYMQGVSFRG